MPLDRDKAQDPGPDLNQTASVEGHRWGGRAGGLDSPSEAPLRTNLLSTYFCRIHNSFSALREHPHISGVVLEGLGLDGNGFTACCALWVWLFLPPNIAPQRSR